MSNRPYSTRRVRLVPDLNDPNLYGAWGMVPQGGLLVDHTVQGNDGTPGKASVVEQTILGPMRRYLPNSGALGSALGAANAFPLSNVTVSTWVRKDLGSADLGWIANYGFGVSDAWGPRFSAAASLAIFDDIDNANATRYVTPVPQGKLLRVDAELSSLENLLYVDGVLVGSGESASDNWASYTGTLLHGDRLLVAISVISGIVGPLLVYNAAKDQSWVTAEYLKGALATPFKTDWGCRVSVAPEAANSYVGFNSTPFEIISGTWRISMDTINGHAVKVLECVTDGSIIVPTSIFESTPTEAAFGTWDWWGYKDTDDTLNFIFISTTADLITAGYNMLWGADDSVVIQEIGVGNVATGGTAASGSWHQFRPTRRFNGLFTGYVDRTAFGTGTDLTTTTSSYMGIAAKGGGKIAYANRQGDYCIQKLLGEVAAP